MSNPPTGTVTFLFTDIESSTRLAHADAAAWSQVQARHHAILRGAIEAQHGHVFQIVGDAFCAAFATASEAVAVAQSVQRALVEVSLPVRVRMGIHSGAAEAQSDGSYSGYLTLARVSRIMAAASGGQVLLSQPTADLLTLPATVSLRDLGTHRLKDFAAPEHLFQLCAPGLPADFPPLKTAEHPNNLPRRLTSFIGRERVIADLIRLMTSTSLLTLTGSGGVGKTRLSLRLASDQLESFPDGVWFIELAPLADGRLIGNTIASVVGVREEPDRPMTATLADHFRSRSALLMLDNCEHLIAEAASLSETLLNAAPQLKILATSREALGIAGEHAYRVPSLDMPSTDQSLATLSHVASARLFTERALAAKSDFALSAANAPAVAQICRRLDGIPLAIELAAARVKVFAPEQIASRLDDRFRLLTGGSRTALPRQQTLRGAVDWSYNLLDEQERALLRRLSVFAGGWTIEAAEAVCSDQPVNSQQSTVNSTVPSTVHRSLFTGDILDLLTRLVDKSLVVVESDHGEARYRMLETVRQYAREKLLDSGEGERVRDQHLACFLVIAERADGDLSTGANLLTHLQWLVSDLDNLRAAIDWAGESSHPDSALQLASSLWQFWYIRGHSSEGIDRIRSCLAAATSSGAVPRVSALRGRALLGMGYLVWWAQGRADEGRPLLEEALAIAREIGDISFTITASIQLGGVLVRLGEFASARGYLEGGLQLTRTSGANMALDEAFAQGSLGEIHLMQGNAHLAADAYAASLRSTHPDDLNTQAYCLRRLGYLALHAGDLSTADQRFRGSLTRNLEIGERQGVAACLVALAAFACSAKQFERAASLLGSADRILESMRLKLLVLDHIEQDKVTTTLRSHLDASAYDAAFARGRAMSEDEAIAFALERHS